MIAGPTAPDETVRLARFGVVGAAGVVVNTALLWLLTERLGLYYLVASALATEVAILSNFALNNAWTFRSVGDRGGWPFRLARYNLAALGGLLLTVASLSALTQAVGLRYLVANLIAVLSGALWNYGLSRGWVWAGSGR